LMHRIAPKAFGAALLALAVSSLALASPRSARAGDGTVPPGPGGPAASSPSTAEPSTTEPQPTAASLRQAALDAEIRQLDRRREEAAGGRARGQAPRPSREGERGRRAASRRPLEPDAAHVRRRGLTGCTSCRRALADAPKTDPVRRISGAPALGAADGLLAV